MTSSALISKGMSAEHVLATLASAVLLLGVVFWVDRPITAEQTDFSVTYLGARMVYLGLGSNLYDLNAQHNLKSSLLPHGEPLIYEHPPFEALLFAPLASLPYRTAYFLWGLTNVVIWLTLPWVLRPYLPAPRDDLAYFGLWVLFAPLGITLYQGQSSLVMLLLYSIAFVLLKSHHDFRAGVMLGLALLKFQFILPFCLILLLRRRWAFLKGFLTTASFLALLSIIAVGWKGIAAYFHLLSAVAVHPENQSYGSAVDMATIAGLVHAVIGSFAGRWLGLMVVGITSLALILWTALMWQRLDSATENDDLMFGAAIVVSLLAGFHMFTHDLSPMLLAMMISLAHIPKTRQRVTKYVAIVCLTVFWIPPVYLMLLARHRMYILVPILMMFAFTLIRLSPDVSYGKDGHRRESPLQLQETSHA